MAGMIVAPQPIAVDEGAQVLRRGGNAVDAAVVCALVQGVLDPHSSSIGGYVLATVSPTGAASAAEAHAVDAPALAGSHVSPDMWTDALIRPNPRGWGFFLRGSVNEMGYQSICDPGFVRGLAGILERWGTWTWGQACEPAARVAEEGYVVDSHLAAMWRPGKTIPDEKTLLDYIRALRGRISTALLTNFPAHVHDHFRTAWFIDGAFDHIIASCDVKLLKPDPRMYELALQRTGCRPEEAVFIDDREVNVEGARALGMHAVLYETREQTMSAVDALLSV